MTEDEAVEWVFERDRYVRDAERAKKIFHQLVEEVRALRPSELVWLMLREFRYSDATVWNALRQHLAAEELDRRIGMG